MKYVLRTAWLLGWLLLATGQSAQAENRLLSLGTGGVTGVYYPAGGAICRLVNLTRQQHGIRCAVESTRGSVANLERVRSGELDLGIAESYWLFHAYHGSERFQPAGSDTKLRTLLTLYPEYFTLLARSDSAIRSFDDLRGKRVSIGKPGSGQRATLETLLRKKGWRLADFSEALELEPAEQASALCDGRIDVMIYTVGHPSGATKEATRECGSRLVEVADDDVAAVVEQNPYYRWVSIPGGLYDGNPQDTRTFGMSAVFFASSELPEPAAYAIVKAVFEQFDRFRRLHPAFARLEPGHMVKGPYAAPLHPGAERYFRESGLLN
ncbi:TAXI family TRAP transporter solute-binding subunit [Marinobacterium arenosum]|uniref:TAXI family TRAP transporter solute-binding subunit n=1 Tax=Marinobacterium arenosum TaxID=2862496 RepID=UPI001C93D71C|nr:TAXI family TRAP transporter solute-binding subunit [Marinobacterium arenosum]MBY4676400.1 TAXI family TRAP transporter solute-binding subunit [Marinobacterium arenosum]